LAVDKNAHEALPGWPQTPFLFFPRVADTRQENGHFSGIFALSNRRHEHGGDYSRRSARHHGHGVRAHIASLVLRCAKPSPSGDAFARRSDFFQRAWNRLRTVGVSRFASETILLP
jgi:hypothetical protein